MNDQTPKNQKNYSHYKLSPNQNTDNEAPEPHRWQGLVGTISFHALLLLAMIFWWGFTTPLPLPEEKGILINFGTSDDGTGDIQPTPQADKTPKPTEEEKKIEQKIINQPVKPTPAPEKKVVEQDFEETARIEKEIKEKEKKQKQQEEAERKQREQEEQLAQQEKTRKEQEFKDRLKNSIGKNKANGQGGNEGNTGRPGDQGSQDGDERSKYKGTGSGSGNNTGGDGTGFSLKGRSQTKKPTLSDNTLIEGKIVVTIVVDKQGNVTKATSGAKGTTIANANLKQKAEQAAYQAHFNTDPNAPDEQIGTITFVFANE